MPMSAVPRSMRERTSRCNDARWPRPIIRASPRLSHRGRPITISWSGSVRCKRGGRRYGESKGRNYRKNIGSGLSTLHNNSLKIIGDVEQLRFAGGEPGGLRPAWTLGAMPIATGVIGDLQGPTLVTLRGVPSEGRGPADRDRPESTVLLRRQGGAIARQIGGAILAHHISHFEGGAVHRGSSRDNASSGLGVAWRVCGVTWR